MSKASELLEALGLVTQSQINKAGYDRTVVGSIVAIENEETLTYSVKYGDATHTAKGSSKYNINDQVYITIPANDESAWQILSLAQGQILDGQWIDYKDVPQDNLFSAATNRFSVGKIYPSLNVDLYNDWVIAEIKKKKKLYIDATFLVTPEKGKRSSLFYELKFCFNNSITKTFSINDMTGDPTQGEDYQIGCLYFTEEEAEQISSLTEIYLNTEFCSVTVTGLAIRGTYSPDLNSTYPIECRIYRGRDKEQNINGYLVTNNLISTLSDKVTSYDFTAQLCQGSVELLEINTSYKWQREEFDWDSLSFKWKDYADTKDITVDTGLYPITNFRCIVTYNDVEYISTTIKIEDNKPLMSIVAELGKGSLPKYYVTLTATDAIKWKFVGAVEDMIIFPSGINLENNIASVETNEEVVIDASLIETPLKIYCSNGSSYGELTLANIGRESSNIEVLNIATYMYNLGGELVGMAPLSLEAKFYDSQGSLVTEGVDWSWEFPSSNTLLIDNRPFSYKKGQVVSKEEYDALQKRYQTQEFFVEYTCQKDFKVETSSCSFGLESYYDIEKTNNTIIVKAHYEGVTYIYIASIGILRTGEPGTNGTDIICKIGVSRKTETASGDNEKWGAYEYPAYEQVSTASLTCQKGEDKTLTETSANKLKFKVRLEHVMSKTVFEPTSIMWFKWSDPDNEATTFTAGEDIICAKVVYEDKTYYAYLPIAKYTNTKLKEGSGFAHVMYQPNGTNPSYFIAAFESENNSKPISSISANYPQYWASLDSSLPVPANNFSLVDNYETKTSKPVSYRNIILTFTLDNGGGTVTLPILFRYNAYGLAQVNAWDGSSVTLADGAVMAPMAGFGSKNDQNQFSGVLLGAVSPTNTDGSTLPRKGIFGECQGEETFFLNSDDGSATFGKEGKGQIVIDPSQNEAIIKGGNYSKEQKTGMQINLSEPSIEWGSGKFKVDKDGTATMSGATFTGIQNATGPDNKPLAQKIEVFWAAQEKGLGAPTSGWSSTQPNVNLDTNDLWQKIIYTYFGGGTQTSIVNTTANSYTLSLSQDTDVIAKTNAGEFVSTLPTIEATLWCGATQIAFPEDNSNPKKRYDIAINCKDASGNSVSLTKGTTEDDHYHIEWSQTNGKDDYKTLKFVFTKLPANFDSSTITFYAPGISAATSKTFTLRTVTSEVDYDLIIPSVVNTSNENKEIQIQVLKKTKDGSITLSSAGTEPIEIYIDNAETPDSDWKTTISQGSSSDVKITLKSTSVNNLIWDEEIIEVVKDGQNGQDGQDAYVLNLTNDLDVVVKNNAGIYISAFPIETTAELYAGSKKITTGVSYEWKLGNTTIDTNSKLSLTSTTYAAGEYTVTATITGTTQTFTKTFTVREITAEVDYDLIVPASINLDTSSSIVQVKVLKTGIGYNGDTSNSATLTAKGDHLIKLQQYQALGWTDISNWTSVNINNGTRIRIVSTASNLSGLIWDEENIAVVRNGKGTPGDNGRSVIAQNPCICYFPAPSSSDFSLPVAPTNATLPEHPSQSSSLVVSTNLNSPTWYLLKSAINIPAVIGETKVFAAQCTQVVYSDDNIEYTAVTLVQAIANLTQWASENDQTLIDGGNIYAGSVSAGIINTDALRSLNYRPSNTGPTFAIRDGKVSEFLTGDELIPPENTFGHRYATLGTYFDLKDGNIYSKNFSIHEGNAYFKGHIEAKTGKIGNMTIGDLVQNSTPSNSSNLLWPSKPDETNNKYRIYEFYYFNKKPANGKTYTFSAKIDFGDPLTNNVKLSLYDSSPSGNNHIITHDVTASERENGIVSFSFVWGVSYNIKKSLQVYISPYKNELTDYRDYTSTIYWAQLEEGEQATAWHKASGPNTGRNLLLNSGQIKSVTNQDSAEAGRYYPSIVLENYKVYTITMKFKTDADYLMMHSSQHDTGVVSLYSSEKNKETIYSKSFVMKYNDSRIPTSPTDANAYLSFWSIIGGSSTPANSTIYWVKIEEGDVATEWSAAPEDSMSAYVNNNFSWQFSPTEGIKMWNGLQATGELVFKVGPKESGSGNELFIKGHVEAQSGNIGGMKILEYNGFSYTGTTSHFTFGDFKSNSVLNIINNNKTAFNVSLNGEVRFGNFKFSGNSIISLDGDAQAGIVFDSSSEYENSHKVNYSIYIDYFDNFFPVGGNEYPDYTLNLRAYAKTTNDILAGGISKQNLCFAVWQGYETISNFHNVLSLAAEGQSVSNASFSGFQDYGFLLSQDWLNEAAQRNTMAYLGVYNGSVYKALMGFKVKKNSYNKYSLDGDPYVYSTIIEDTLNYKTISGTTLTSRGSFYPSENGKYTLGGDGIAWSQIYAVSPTILSSDINKKTSLESLTELYNIFFNKISPIRYKFINNTSDRYHLGFGSQYIRQNLLEAGLTTKDFAGYIEWDNKDGTKGYGLRYEEFIALNTWQIQKLKSRTQKLENKILLLEEQINSLTQEENDKDNLN